MERESLVTGWTRMTLTWRSPSCSPEKRKNVTPVLQAKRKLGKNFNLVKI